MNKSGPILALILLMFITVPVNAFFINAQSQTVSVRSGTSRQISMEIGSQVSDKITVSLLDSKPWTTLENSFFEIDRNNPATVNIIASPFLRTGQGLYRVGVVAESVLTGEIKKKDIFINVGKGEIVDVERLTITGDIIPTGSAVITADIKNFRTSSAQDIDVVFTVSSPEGVMAEFTHSIGRLDPEQTTTAQKVLTIPAGAPSGAYTVDVAIKYLDEQIDFSRTFTVMQKAIVEQREETFPLLFGYGKNIIVENNGNAPADQVRVEQSLSGVEKAFLSGEEPFTMTEEGAVWLVNNVPADSAATVTYRVDYAPLFLFLIVLAFAIWFYLTRLRTVRIRKYIMQSKEVREGEEFTVGIDVKNALGREVDAVVRDFVPQVFKVKQAQGPKPKKKKTKLGTELTWDVSKFKPGEERVFSYKIVPKFGVHGQIRLPRASADFRHRGKDAVSNSSYTRIGMKMKD